VLTRRPAFQGIVVDAGLERRLQLFKGAGTVDADLCAFVRAELERLDAAGLAVTDDSAGMLTSHLLMALQRVRGGEPAEEPVAGDLVVSQLAGHEEAVARAHGLAERANQAYGVALPPHEVDFLALHFAALKQLTPHPGGDN
jgi:hypothetical protein